MPVLGTSHSVWGGPPDASTFFSFPVTKKPIKRLSGDQKGNSAPSVPGSNCAVSESIERTHRPVAAMNASRLPSGEIAMPLPYAVFSGAGSRKRTAARSGGFSVKWRAETPANASASASAPATSQTGVRRETSTTCTGAAGVSGFAR